MPKNGPFWRLFDDFLATFWRLFGDILVTFWRLFGVFLSFVHSKCKRSSLRSQCWMRLFLWFSNTVHSAATACTKRFRNVELIVFEKPRQENERVKLIFNSGRKRTNAKLEIKSEMKLQRVFYLQGDQEILKSRITANSLKLKKFMKFISKN